MGLMRQAVSQIQIWIRARMPGYSLNQTARSSAIHRGQMFRLGHPKVAQPKWRPFGLESPIHWYPIWHESQTAQPKGQGSIVYMYVAIQQNTKEILFGRKSYPSAKKSSGIFFASPTGLITRYAEWLVRFIFF